MGPFWAKEQLLWLIKSQYRIKASLWLPFKCVCVFYCTIAHSPIRSVSEWLLPFIYLFTLYYLSVDLCSLLSIPCYTALYSLSLHSICLHPAFGSHKTCRDWHTADNRQVCFFPFCFIDWTSQHSLCEGRQLWSAQSIFKPPENWPAFTPQIMRTTIHTWTHKRYETASVIIPLPLNTLWVPFHAPLPHAHPHAPSI